MQIVINISKKDYDKMCRGELIDTILVAIKNGIPLPKGHGRLIDADELDNDLKERQKSYEYTFGIRQPINEAVKDGIIIARTHIDDAPTIIEANIEACKAGRKE